MLQNFAVFHFQNYLTVLQTLKLKVHNNKNDSAYSLFWQA